MRFPASFVAFTVALTSIAAPPAETPAAAFTRSHRLKASVTFAAKDKPLKQLLDEIADQVEEQKLGRLRFDVPGVLNAVNPLVTYSCKAKPLESVLADILASAELTFAVVSTENDKSDGWLRLKKGEPKPAAPATTPLDADDEKDATRKLDAAKTAMENHKPEDAKILLKYVMRKYPQSSQAAAAKTLLEKVGP